MSENPARRSQDDAPCRAASANCASSRDPGEGWSLASVTGGGHLRRVLEMCEEMGFETYLEEVLPDTCGECTECFQAAGERIFRVYQRPRQTGAAGKAPGSP